MRNELISCIQEDYKAIHFNTKKVTIKKILLEAIRNHLFRYIVVLRCTKILEPYKIIHYLLRIIHRRQTILWGIEIPWMTKIGPGFKISHGNGIVINKNVIIGSSVTIRNGVTFGTSKGKSPRIGDHTEFGVGSVVIGDVIVGEYSIIGANAVVTKDVEPYSIMAGVPAVKIGIRDSMVKYF